VVDRPVLLAASVTALAIGLLTGIAPATFSRGTPGFEDLKAGARASRRMGVAAALALLLAAMGLYSVIAYTVRQREHEFGVRRAVGARAADLVRLVLTQSAAYAAGGIALGATVAYSGTRFVAPLMYREVNARDPRVFVAAGLVLIGACLVAAMLPARTAARVHPRVALQAE
jgi:putative ABC transport system permease protein